MFYLNSYTDTLVLFVKNNSIITIVYYSTMMSFYHIWSRERAKYETVIHCSVPTKPENLACHRLSLVISFIQSNKGY